MKREAMPCAGEYRDRKGEAYLITYEIRFGAYRVRTALSVFYVLQHNIRDYIAVQGLRKSPVQRAA